jgi:chemotaxis protein MotB
MKPTHMCITAAAAALVLGGCVTQGTYEELQAQKNQEIATLESERAALETQRTALETQRTALAQQVRTLEEQRAALEAESASLASEKSEIEGQRTELLKQVNVLETQKSKLVSASRQSQAQYDALVDSLSDQVQKGQLQIRRYKDMLTVDVAEQLFFDSGKAALKDGGKVVLKQVAAAMQAYDEKAIRVVGHTDDVPIAKAWRNVFASNWELSAARATTVVRFLQEAGIEPGRLIATGRAQYDPVAPNDSAEGRQKNRRIEITLIDRSLLQEEQKQ